MEAPNSHYPWLGVRKRGRPAIRGHPQLEWVTFEELSYDNAKANLAGNVVNKIASVVGCAVNPGPVEFPECHAIIERLFETLEEATGHRVPSTTGSNPQDPRRTNPDAAAEKFEITLDHLYELMDLVIARYNATPHSGIGYKAPLELMAQFAADEHSLMNKIPEDKRNKLGLLNVEFKRTVRGNIKEGEGHTSIAKEPDTEMKSWPVVPS